MDVYQHFSLSLAYGVLASFIVSEAFLPVVLVSVVAGTLIDLDHFLISRVIEGDWTYLKKALESPVITLFDIGSVLDNSIEFRPGIRLFSHCLEGFSLTVLGLSLSNPLFLIGAGSVWVHVSADIYADEFGGKN